MEKLTQLIKVSLISTFIVAVTSTLAQAMPDKALKAHCPVKHGYVGQKMGEHHKNPFQDVLTGFYSGEVNEDWQSELMSAGCLYYVTESYDHSMATVLLMEKAKDDNNVDIVKAGWIELYYPRKDARSEHYKENIPKVCFSPSRLTDISIQQRIANCYYSRSAASTRSYPTVSQVIRETVDVLKYYYSSRKSVLENLKKVDPEYAKVSEVVERALAIGWKTENMQIVLKALGYTSSLFDANYWVKRSVGDAGSQKIVAAAMALDAQGMMFIDTNYFEKNQGPAVINQDEFVQNQMIHLMGYNLDADLQFAMERAGFSYSPSWIHESPIQNKVD